jgi:demethylmenaquinone methyltransferase/2-methoxy-6-polyprenyl-1,4-benzoquinol methylase
MRHPHEDDLVASKSPAGVRAMFHAIAPTYDFLNRLLSLGIDQRWRRRVARLIISPPTRRILDVCSGTGDLALALAARARAVGAPVTVTACDFTPAMMARGRDKFAASPVASALPGALVADTMRLPFASGTFDAVTVAFGIRNVADFRAGLHEMVRVCRPGGSVAVLEFSKPRNRVFSTLYGFYFHRILPRIGHAITGTRAYRYLPKSVAQFPEGPEFAACLAAIAGGPVEVIPVTGGIATIYIARKPNALRA